MLVSPERAWYKVCLTIQSCTDIHMAIQVTDYIALDEQEIEEHFIRATGPGGQKVNKTESAVQIRFDAKRSANLADDVFLRTI